MKTVLVFLLLVNISHAQFQIMSKEDLEIYRKAIPKIEDKDWQKFFDDPTTMYYTDKEIPPAFQFASIGSGIQQTGQIASSDKTGFFSVYYNLAGNLDRFGHGNREFPWKTGVPGGTDASANNLQTFKMIWLPKQKNGKPVPIIYYRQTIPGAAAGTRFINGRLQNVYYQTSALKWMFPRDTIIAECLALKGPDNFFYTFEIRIRMRQKDYWDIEILRPYPNRTDFMRALAKIDKKAYQAANKAHFIKEKLFNDSNHTDKHAFLVTAYKEYLPDLHPTAVKKLLTETSFKTSAGEEWSHIANDKTKRAYTASTKQKFSIVPVEYDGTALGTTHTSCVKCHEDTLTHVDIFQNEGREWYGFIRGSDNILSFHPIVETTISGDGNFREPLIRGDMLTAGIVAKFDPAIHKPDRYEKLGSLE